MKKVFISIIFTIMVVSLGILFYKEYSSYKNEEEIKRKADDYFFVLTYYKDELVFDELELEIQAFYFEIECGKQYSVEELKKAYIERNDLFYDYINNFSKVHFAPRELEYSLSDISLKEWNLHFSSLSQDERNIAKQIYIEEQKLVTDYYGDSRIKLYNLTETQRLEFYTLYKNPTYVFDDELMETNQPFGGRLKYEVHATITKIEGDTYTLKEEDDIDGPFAVAVSVDTGSNGQLIWFSSNYFLEESYNAYSSGANLDLAMNALSSLIGEREAVSIRSKSLSYNYLTISESAAAMLKTWMIGVIPAAFVLYGVFTVIDRRKKRHA